MKIRIKRFPRGGIVWGDEAIVDENLDVLTVKLELPVQPRLRFEATACAEGRAGRLGQAFLIAAVEDFLAIVADAEAVAGVVNAVVSLVPDQDDPGARGNMGIVGNVDEQLIAILVFNPAVKNRNQRLEACPFGILEGQFHVDVLELHLRTVSFPQLFTSQANKRVCERMQVSPLGGPGSQTHSHLQYGHGMPCPYGRRDVAPRPQAWAGA